MKTKFIYSFLFVMMFALTGRTETIAVSNFSTSGLDIKPEYAAKFARLELIKLEKYKVLDEFDMAEVMEGNTDFYTCYGKSCLIELGKALKVDYVLSGSVDEFSNKIVITIKMIDVNASNLKATRTMEFDNQNTELQRMIGIMIQEMHGVAPDPFTKSQLEYKNEVITSNNVGRMNNSGPRVGVAYVATGDLTKFYTRKESQGGLGILPLMTTIGYQFEAQYIGTENFSALGELVLNIGGMEQGQFIPTMTLMNGFRFGKAGWEFAFGPSFGVRKYSTGIEEEGIYYRRDDYEQMKYNEWRNDPTKYNPTTGDVYVPYVAPDQSLYSKFLDKRGSAELNANWVMAFGRTFRSGALNIPVNLYYSSNKYGGIIGASVGFNVNKRIKLINE